MTPSGIEPTIFRFVAQHFNHCATVRSPEKSNKHINKICAPSWFYLQDSCTQFDENSADVLTVIAFAVSAADDWQYQNTAGYFIVAGHAQEGQP